MRLALQLYVVAYLASQSVSKLLGQTSQTMKEKCKIPVLN